MERTAVMQLAETRKADAIGGDTETNPKYCNVDISSLTKPPLRITTNVVTLLWAATTGNVCGSAGELKHLSSNFRLGGIWTQQIEHRMTLR